MARLRRHEQSGFAGVRIQFSERRRERSDPRHEAGYRQFHRDLCKDRLAIDELHERSCHREAVNDAAAGRTKGVCREIPGKSAAYRTRRVKSGCALRARQSAA